MDHDRLFKELLTEFFFDFLELFFPNLAARIDRSRPPEVLDKESFGEPLVDSRPEMDLVARLRLTEGEACFLVHLEHEGQNRGGLPVRMFRYFSRLWDRYQLPIYPIALFSFAGRKPQPQRFSLHFHDLTVLDFRYRTVQLNRPRVKVQCLRLLATLRLAPAKSRLISRFVDAYLSLNALEMRTFDQTLENLPLEERKQVMSFTTSWEQQGLKRGLKQGREEGRQEGLRCGLQVAVRRLFGECASDFIERLNDCDLPRLQRLQERLAAGADLEELERAAEE